ncbi:MAG: response regulator, partial [Desulfuromonadales bacterium]|nr:response regulator [Desulfuromonadales bacterium]
MRRILVVDDDVEIRELLGLILSSDGYRVEKAQDGGIALKKFEEDIYDLVITDIRMPNIDGNALVKQIRIKNATVPIVAYTGSEELIESAFDRVLSKPIRSKQLIGAVTSLLGATAQPSAAGHAVAHRWPVARSEA